MSLDQVISGIDKITGGLENAAKKAVQLGEELWNNVMNKAQWADDTATMALMYGIDLDTFLRMQKLVTNGLDTSVDSMLTSQDKLKRGIGKNSKEVMSYLKELGLVETMYGGKVEGGTDRLVTEDSVDLFFRAGQALLSMSSGYDKEAAATALFGKSWKELVPLFTSYKSVDEYNAALQEVNVNSEEDVNALSELNDKVSELKGNLETLSTDILAQLAPALTEGAEALNGLLTSLLEYLKTDEGKEMLKSLGDAVSGLFTDLSKIDPQDVITGFTGVFNKIIGGFEWLLDNKNGVIHALEAIVMGWAGLKLTGGALEIMKLINGVQTFNGIDTGAPQNVTGGDGTVLANGTSGGGVWSKLLNGATLFAAANAMYEATEGQIRKNVENFNKSTEGMTDQQRQREALKINFGMTDDEATKFVKEKEIDVSTEFVPEDDAAKKLADEVGVVVLPAQLHILGGTRGIGTGGENMMRMLGETANASYSYANGLPFVPYDGYLARLHKGERVMTASQNRSYSANSNLYIENMNMNNGMDAQALASAMSAQNRRISAGFGS